MSILKFIVRMLLLDLSICYNIKNYLIKTERFYLHYEFEEVLPYDYYSGYL